MVNCIDQSSILLYTSNTQLCYLLGDFNINLPFKGEEIFGKKNSKAGYREMPFLTKKYLEYCFSNSLEQIIVSAMQQQMLIEQQCLLIMY